MLSFRAGVRPARSKPGTYDFRAPSAPLKRQSGRKGEAIASSGTSLETDSRGGYRGSRRERATRRMALVVVKILRLIASTGTRKVR